MVLKWVALIVLAHCCTRALSVVLLNRDSGCRHVPAFACRILLSQANLKKTLPLTAQGRRALGDALTELGLQVERKPSLNSRLKRQRQRHLRLAAKSVKDDRACRVNEGRGEEGQFTAYFLVECGVQRNGGRLNFLTFQRIAAWMGEDQEEQQLREGTPLGLFLILVVCLV